MKNTRKGFTLVELLAVIVILAIIMIIAIPSVLGTMTTARQKSFCEYVTKVYMAAENKYTAAQTLGTANIGNSYSITMNDGTKDITVYLYDVKTDLGLENVGDYVGFVGVVKPSGSRTKPLFFVALHDSNYTLFSNEVDNKYYYEYTKEPTSDNLEDFVSETDWETAIGKSSYTKVTS